MVSAAARGLQVRLARRLGMSTRTACKLVRIARATLRYKKRMDEKDAPLLELMHTIAEQHPRYGYRRVHNLLGRAGYAMSKNRAQRLWQKAGLQVPVKHR
jgi:putative transposase